MDIIDKDKASFDRLIQDYLEAFNAGDFKRVASYWTEDAIHSPPMGDEIHGRAALEEFYRQTFETFKPRLSDYSYECRFSGENVFVRESWTITMHPAKQESICHSGKGLWIGRKEMDGVWRSFWALARIDQPTIGTEPSQD